MEKKIMIELVDGILRIMKSRVKSIILYGSVARGANTEESDIDIAILVRGMLDNESEDMLSELIVDLNLEYDKVFSVIDIEYEMFQKWENTIPFYQNINREGIILWEAA